MSNFRLQNVDFSRQTLLNKTSRPLPVLALYPTNTASTTLSVTVSSTQIIITYISSAGTETPSVTYTDKSSQEVALEISALDVPITARAIHQVASLNSGDMIDVSASVIPNGFNAYDRIESNGIVLRANKIAVRHKRASKINVLPPYAASPSLPWYPRITNGAFTQEKDGRTYTFNIPEFDNQPWSLIYGKPFRDLENVTPTLVSKNVYQLPRFPVFWNGENISLFNGDAPISANLIEDVDVNNGLLYLKAEANVRAGFNVDYTYLETTYEYRELNVNSHLSQNPLLLDKYVVFYLLPAEGNNTARKRSVYHVVADSIEEGTNSIILPDQDTPIAIIGAYNIRQLFNADKLSVLDTRSLGGGMKMSSGPKSAKLNIGSPLIKQGREIEDVYSEGYRFWDVGNYDGESYPGAAVVAMDLPEDSKNILPISDLTNRATKHLTAGVYPSLKFTERELPSVSGISSQISAAYNLDLSEQYTKETTSTEDLLTTIPSSFEGAGWLLRDLQVPDSILVPEDWQGFNPFVLVTGNQEKYIEVDKDTAAVMPYLRSSARPGISWEERNVNVSVTTGQDDVLYSPWKKITAFDTSEVETGKVEKKYFTLSSDSIKKQFRNFKINSPFITGNLTEELYNELDTIIGNVFDLQAADENTDQTTYGTQVIYSYSDVTDKSAKAQSSSYILNSPLYNNIFKLDDTPLEDKYSGQLDQIGKDFILHGTYNTGHLMKVYSFPENEYVTYEEVSQEFDFSDALTTLADYLNFKNRRNSWESVADTGAFVLRELVKTLNSTLTEAEYANAVPSSWIWRIPSFTFSGVAWPTEVSLGTQQAEVTRTGNYDYAYNYSFAPFISSVLSSTGESISDSSLLSAYSNLFNVTENYTVADNEASINATRTKDGFDTTTHWFVGHNRLGTYLGNTLVSLIKGYEYLKKYQVTRGAVQDVSQPSGASLNDLNTLFGWIEQILDEGYDALYHNLLRGGIAESETANAIFGYGWYLNNWKENYGLRGKTYTTPLKTKFVNLFEFGIQQCLKNLFNSSSEFLETITINSDPGPFGSRVPTKFLLPLAEAVKYNYQKYAGIAEALINNLKNTYSNDGLYYLDPYKATSTPGNLEQVLEGYTRMYRYLASTGSFNTWEPVSSDLDELRATEFLPQFDSYGSDPVSGWDGVKNTISFWKYYNSGDVEASAKLIKSFGINTIEMPLDYMYWRQNSGEFINRLDHLYQVCSDNSLRIIPTLFDGNEQSVSEANLSGYVNDYGYTGGRYYYEGITGKDFVYGAGSGEVYISTLLSGYDSHPATLAWSMARKPVNNAQAVANYNTLAYEIKEFTTTPVIYNIDKNLSLAEFQSITSGTPSINPYLYAEPNSADDTFNLVSPLYNDNYDFIGVQPDSLFSYFLSVTTGQLVNSSKKVVVTNQGDGAYADYDVTLRSINLPFGLSNLFVVSGEEYGVLYSDGTSRNSRQLQKIVDSAIADGVSPTGEVIQEKLFLDKHFYQTGYNSSTTSVELASALEVWNTREQFSASTSGSLYTQVLALQRLQESFNTLNFVSQWTEDKYNVPQVFSVVDCQNLDYYASTWSGVNVFDTGATYYLTGSELDYNRYNTFVDDWAGHLYSLYLKLVNNG